MTLIWQLDIATITDSGSEPFEDSKETEIPQPLPIAPSPIPPLDNPYLIVRQAHTPVTIDTESELEEAPSETEEFEASEPSNTMITSPYSTTSSDSTTPLSFDHPLAQTLPTSTRVSYYRSTARMTVRTQLTLSMDTESELEEAPSETEEFEASEPSNTRITSPYSTNSSDSTNRYPLITYLLRHHLPRPEFHTTVVPHLVKDIEDESLDSTTERKSLEEEGLSLEDEGPGLEKKEEAAP
nr:hypothetical protein [Tanacetum cinerariifolium]